MTLQVALHHKSIYSYDREVTLSPQEIRLRPALYGRTPILGYSLKIQPSHHFLKWIQDPLGNFVARVTLPDKVHKLSIEVDLIADLSPINPFDSLIDATVCKAGFEYEPALKRQLVSTLQPERRGPRLAHYLKSIQVGSSSWVDFLVSLNKRVHSDIKYLIRLEPGVWSCEETLEKRAGSCRDIAWLLVEILRNLGYAARFVSGYLIQLTSDQRPLDGPEGPPHDFTDLHAWAEVYTPGTGWVGLDPTSGLLAAEGHIPLAASPSPEMAAPVIGLVDECEVDFEFSMSLERIKESPRPTRPYSDDQWRGIMAIGETIDADLTQNDVRLTMGGEPTFVAHDDREGDEWHTTAHGPTKRVISGNLLRRLYRRFSPGGLLHYGQGRWYAGEELPRWALYSFWRKDGEPVWKDETLLADESLVSNLTITEAELFASELARRLGVDSQFIHPAYEDVWYYLITERNLPVNIDPLLSNLNDSSERKRLANIFSQGLGAQVGYVVPLRGRFDGTRVSWESGPWFLRSQKFFLLPGDSPIGFRLPLDSLFWESTSERQKGYPPDSFAPRSPLPSYPLFQRGRDSVSKQSENWLRDDMSGHTGPVVRTALCIEPRSGHLYIFLPPLDSVEAYLDLVATIEETASVLHLPVFLEGYLPPPDPRLLSFKITPDPGVIEVNIHPSDSWQDLVKKTEILYEEARQCRLSTEKFLIDGRQTGTGGGNHITIGGPTPADSPLLRRPDLLGSLVTYWQNHPSLSYLFSNLFLGPTSQSPRVDEARDESLYEMAIALEQTRSEGASPPWLVDRLFRNILIDVTGNTHRVEFCMDKLYSPDSAEGRLGLLELRAFEMPPHPRMSLAQLLIVRGLVSRFWQKPYDRPLVSWGTALHDRFMLPYFINEDFKGVLDELVEFGYSFQMEWYAPFFNVRFPFIGQVTVRDVQIELRYALEPWHVLGEEVTRQGSSRYVDSSVERIQIRVSSLNPSRFVVCCNGRPVPLKGTGIPGEFVAGIRFKAWNPPSALHPTIPAMSLLVFDLVDSWTGRSVGGCCFHVFHPGGRGYEFYPVNDREAHARLAERYQPFGHTPGPMDVQAEGVNPSFPLTLDLRRQPIRADGFMNKFDPYPAHDYVARKGHGHFQIKRDLSLPEEPVVEGSVVGGVSQVALGQIALGGVPREGRSGKKE